MWSFITLSRQLFGMRILRLVQDLTASESGVEMSPCSVFIFFECGPDGNMLMTILDNTKNRQMDDTKNDFRF